MDILLIGRIAEQGTVTAAARHMGTISGQLPSLFLKNGIAALDIGFLTPEAESKLAGSCIYIRRLSGESIYGALWNLGEELETGLRVRLADIPITEFCISVADILDINPYLMDSTGCVLAVTTEGRRLAEELGAAMIPAAVIGYLTEDRKRCIESGEVTSFLTGHEDDNGGF